MPVKLQSKNNSSGTRKYGIWTFIKAPRKSNLQRLALVIHKWLGISIALYIIVMSLSGVSLVFYDELSDLLYQPGKVTVASQTCSFNQIRDAVETTYSYKHVTGFIASTERDRPFSFFATDAGENSTLVEVDPYTGKVLGTAQENEVLKFLRDLHFNLLNGTGGRTVNGYGAVALLIVSITGLIAWFRGIDTWSSGFRLSLRGTPRTIVWNIHSAIGIYALPLLCIWSVSGIYFGFPTFFERATNTVFPVSQQQNDHKQVQQAAKKEVERIDAKANLDELARTAINAVPEATAVQRISLANKRRQSIRVWLRLKDSKNEAQVHIDPVTSAVFAVVKPESALPGDLFLQWLARLHFGTFFGTASKCVWLIAGLVPSILSISAIYLFASGFKRQNIPR